MSSRRPHLSSRLRPSLPGPCACSYVLLSSTAVLHNAGEYTLLIWQVQVHCPSSELVRLRCPRRRPNRRCAPLPQMSPAACPKLRRPRRHPDAPCWCPLCIQKLPCRVDASDIPSRRKGSSWHTKVPLLRHPKPPPCCLPKSLLEPKTSLLVG